MNRKLFGFLLSVLLLCGFTAILYPLLDFSDKSISRLIKNKKENNSFVIVLDNITMIEATLVSIYSLQTTFLQRHSNKKDILLIIHDSLNVDSNKIRMFEKLGVYISQMHWDRFSENKKYEALSKLWKLSTYDKMIYFTHDILFDNDVDQLFDQLPNSAIMSTTKILSLLLFSRSSSINAEYREADKYGSFYNITDILLDNKKLYVFSGPMKPWEMYWYRNVDWVEFFEPVFFYRWRRLSNDMNRFLHSEDTAWKNSLRQNSICNSYLSTKSDQGFFLKNQFSVLLSTYNPERIRHLSDNIKHLLKSRSVDKIYVTWHNPLLKIPVSLYSSINPQDHHRLKILRQSYDSLNNRFNPISDLRTEAVYIMDDDIFVDLEDLELTFNIWKSNVNSIVGHFPRIHSYDSKTQQATYRVSHMAPYSIILTKSMFVRSEYLFAYTCVLEPKLHEYVDKNLNCEDLGFAMMTSGLSQAAPVLVNTKMPIEDFGLKKGISTNSKHMPARSECISQFISQFWNGSDPLVKSADGTSHFHSVNVRKGNWNRVKQIMARE